MKPTKIKTYQAKEFTDRKNSLSQFLKSSVFKNIKDDILRTYVAKEFMYTVLHHAIEMCDDVFTELVFVEYSNGVITLEPKRSKKVIAHTTFGDEVNTDLRTVYLTATSIAYNKFCWLKGISNDDGIELSRIYYNSNDIGYSKYSDSNAYFKLID